MDDCIFHQVPDRVGDRMSVAFGMYRSIRARECELSFLDQSPGSHGRYNTAGHLIELDGFADIQHDCVQPGDTQQLLNQSIHASDVGLEFDEIAISLHILECSVYDRKRRPQFVSRIRSELPLDCEALVDAVECAVDRGHQGAISLGRSLSGSRIDIVCGPIAAAISDTSRTGLRPRRTPRIPTASAARTRNETAHMVSWMNFLSSAYTATAFASDRATTTDTGPATLSKLMLSP